MRSCTRDIAICIVVAILMTMSFGVASASVLPDGDPLFATPTDQQSADPAQDTPAEPVVADPQATSTESTEPVAVDPQATPTDLQATPTDQATPTELEEGTVPVLRPLPSPLGAHNDVSVMLPHDISFQIAIFRGTGTGVVTSDEFMIINNSPFAVDVNLTRIYMEVGDPSAFHISSTPDLLREGNSIYVNMTCVNNDLVFSTPLSSQPADDVFSYRLESGERGTFSLSGIVHEFGTALWADTTVTVFVSYNILPADEEESQEPQEETEESQEPQEETEEPMGAQPQEGTAPETESEQGGTQEDDTQEQSQQTSADQPPLAEEQGGGSEDDPGG